LHLAFVAIVARARRACPHPPAFALLPPPRRWPRVLNTLLAWYFVAIWGTGFIASKIALQHAAPFTFLSIRFAFGITPSMISCIGIIITCMGVALVAWRPAAPLNNL